MNSSVRSRPTSRVSPRVTSRSESVSTGAPSDSPRPADVSTVLRSGISRISQVIRNARTMTAVATRNTTLSASVKAWM